MEAAWKARLNEVELLAMRQQDLLRIELEERVSAVSSKLQELAQKEARREKQRHELAMQVRPRPWGPSPAPENPQQNVAASRLRPSGARAMTSTAGASRLRGPCSRHQPRSGESWRTETLRCRRCRTGFPCPTP